MKTSIKITDINSSGIASEANSLGITTAEFLGAGQYDGREGADNKVRFYALINPKNGFEFRVADTSGDPVWEEQDQQGFADLAAACDVAL